RSQRIPTRIGSRLAGARPGIEIGATCRTEPRTIWAALHEGRDGKQPLLAHRRPQVELAGLRVEMIDIRIVIHLGVVGLGVDERDLLGDWSRGGCQAAAALRDDLSLELPAEVEAAGARAR